MKNENEKPEQRHRGDHDRDHDRGHERRDHDRDRHHEHHEPPCPPEHEPWPRPRKIIERIWWFDDDDCDERGGHGGHGGHGGGGHGGRPGRPQGGNTGELNGQPPAVVTTGGLKHPLPPLTWPGTRAQMDLPFLFIRANAGDLGARPVTGAPFWESPDIFVAPGIDPATAPDLPPTLGGLALAGVPNTLYAHVWNFGKASANEVFVEFYWVNPSLGINASTVQLIAQTTTQLGSKTSGQNHAVVKCPEAWVPTLVNGGHECLLVRVWDNPADLPGDPQFDASINRHVGQRNIHVSGVGAGADAAIAARALRFGAGAPALASPLLINVGPLYGAPAKVSVARAAPHQVPWLQLHTGQRGVFPAQAVPTGLPSLSVPIGGGGFPTGANGSSHTVHGDDLQVAFTTTDQAPGPGEAHVYRITAEQQGAVFGGYTVVVLG